ncbi:MAG: hypothetical protein HY550_12445 [Elusimicrobia bacterium]|nr:hypothetical protein [Elusimicrobiota bacterium]
MKKLLFIALLAALPPGAGALELLLEENRGESGTIGFVDIDRVFKEYSGTTGAREEFIAEIKKKEEVLNSKKAPIFTLKAEIAKLKQEREFALTLPSLLETQRSVAEAAAATAAAAEAAKQAAEETARKAAEAAALALQVSSGTVEVSTSGAQVPAEGVQASTAAPQVPPAQQAQPAPQAQPPQQAQPAAQPPAAASLPGMEGIDMPGIAKVPVTHFKFSVSTSVPEIETALAAREAELAAKEEELRLLQLRTERELLEYESRKSEVLLGRIYVALRELAIKEEVSVIIDKRNILFGQKAVDLTGKLLKRLEESGL